MKSWLSALLLLLASNSVLAQSTPAQCAGISTPQGCYTMLRDSSGLLFRDDDPFLFCTDGMIERPRAWNPLVPIAGTWFPTPGYCPIPSTSCPYPYYISWSQREVDGVYLYMRVCPAAGRQGQWEGPGRPESTPHSH